MKEDPMTPTRPSDLAVNEAAERLREGIEDDGYSLGDFVADLDAALATERRNTVERIIEAAERLHLELTYVGPGDMPGDPWVNLADEVDS